MLFSTFCTYFCAFFCLEGYLKDSEFKDLELEVKSNYRFEKAYILRLENTLKQIYFYRDRFFIKHRFR